MSSEPSAQSMFTTLVASFGSRPARLTSAPDGSLPLPTRMFAAAPTPGSRAAAGATASGVSPDGSKTTNWAVTVFSKAPENDA